MKRFIIGSMLLMLLMLVGCKSDDVAPRVPGGGEPEPPAENFTVENLAVTRGSVTFDVVPADEQMDYLCVVLSRAEVEESTRDEFIVESILLQIADEASSKGMTLVEYMPSIVDRGVATDIRFSGLLATTEYYIILFGVDAEDGYNASTEITKVAFTTLGVEVVDCDFDVTTQVVDNSVTFNVSPADKELKWYLCTMPVAQYNYYVEDEEGYQMSHDYFYQYYFQQEINALLGQGYTEQQVVNALIHSGDLVLEAKGLQENTEYYYLIAGIILDADGIVICTDVERGSYTTQQAAQSAMTFDIKVWNIGQMEASFSITPSNNTDKYCALVAPWDGVTTAEEMMHNLVEQWAGWMDVMANDRGPVVHEGSTAMKLPAADTDYYIIAFGYDGGITTAATMETFRTLPGGSLDEVVFEVTSSNASPYGFTMNVTSSDRTIYYVPGVCAASEYDEATFVQYEREAFNYYFEEYKKFNPSITVAEILDQYYYNGNATLSVSGLMLDTEYMGYIYALDVHTGDVLKSFTFPAFAHTSQLSSVMPQVELFGYFSGDDEGGAIFDDASATKGRAITVVKYTNLDNIRTLFTTMVEGDCSNAVTTSDAELWTLTSGYWQTCRVAQPYSFYLVDWNVVQTALCYATDNSGMIGAISRLYTCPTAENKGNIDDLKALVDELDGDSTRCGGVEFQLPESVVVGDTAPSRAVIKPLE